jgi:hypothetical protein
MIWKWFQLSLLLLVSLLFFTFLVCPVSIVRHLHFGIFSDSLLITFLSPEIVATDKQVHSSLSRFMISELLLGMVLLVCAC